MSKPIIPDSSSPLPKSPEETPTKSVPKIAKELSKLMREQIKKSQEIPSAWQQKTIEQIKS